MTSSLGCDGCRNAVPFPLAFTMAFQPIVDLSNSTVWGYEALVRGINGEGAGAVLAQVTEANRYTFDQACRVKAIELAGQMLPKSSSARLSINFMPNAVYEPRACIKATLAASARVNFDSRRLMFEFTENERITDTAHIRNIVAEYKRMGFLTAIDDFGAGYAGLGLLVRFQPDLVKIDMELLRNIDHSAPSRAIVRGIVSIAEELDIVVLAEGIETEAEMITLQELGINVMQGYLFGRPQIEAFATTESIPHLLRPTT